MWVQSQGSGREIVRLRGHHSLAVLAFLLGAFLHWSLPGTAVTCPSVSPGGLLPRELVFLLFLWMLSDFGRPPTSEYYVCDPGSYLISWKMLMFCCSVTLAGFSSPVLTRLLCVVVSGSLHLQEAFAVLPGLRHVPPAASVSLCGSCHCTSQSSDLLLGSDPRMHGLGGGEAFRTASGAGALS